MTVGDLFEEIEGVELAVDLGAVSSLEHFRVEIRHTEPADRLFRLLEDKKVQLTVVNRVRRLARRGIDPRYVNPLDIALAIYLDVLEIHSPGLAKVGAATVVRAPNLLWAGPIARQILEAGEPDLVEGDTVDEPEVEWFELFPLATVTGESLGRFVVAATRMSAITPQYYGDFAGPVIECVLAADGWNTADEGAPIQIAHPLHSTVVVQ